MNINLTPIELMAMDGGLAWELIGNNNVMIIHWYVLFGDKNMRMTLFLSSIDINQIPIN